MGFAATRAEARQLVSHKAIAVNDGVVTIASYQVQGRRYRQVREKAKKQLRIQSAMQIATQVGLPEWVDVNDKEFRGVFKSVPAGTRSCRTSTRTSSSSCIRSNRFLRTRRLRRV